jgi:surface polysaccharide O-acyltransferase-like enzyme
MGAELLRGLTSSHLYYLVVILGLYLVAPALRLVVQRTRPPVWWGLAACLLSLASTGVITRFMPHNAFTLFLPFLGHFLVGLALRELVLTRHLKRLGWATFLITSVSISAGTGALFERWGPEDYRSLALYDYLHPLVIAQSAAAFVILRSLFTTSAPQSGAGGRLLAVLGPATFGIYLGHVAILDVIRGYTGGLFARATFAVIAGDVLVAFALSAVAALALGRIPYLRRIVG